uniref:EGF-like domain-containing protein n=1 Tax=Strongyloides papillosus TaxID=174720 RepID=A0A0N5C4P0_STREA
MPNYYFGLKPEFKGKKENITYKSIQNPYYDLMMKKRYDFSFSDYKKISYMYCNFTYEDIELILQEFKLHTCLQFEENLRTLKDIGINFFESKNGKNNVKLSRSKDEATNLTLTEEVYTDRFALRFFIAKALGLMPEIQRIDRDLELNIFNDKIQDSFIEEYEKSTYYYSYLFETDFDFKSAAMPNYYFGLKPEFKEKKENITYKSIQNPYYDLMMKKRYDFSFSDYKKISYMYCNFTYEDNVCLNDGYYYEKIPFYCTCPSGYSGQYCQNVGYTYSSCGYPTVINATSTPQQMKLEYARENCIIKIKASKSWRKVQITALKLECQHFCKYRRRLDFIEIKYRDDKSVKGISLFTNQFKRIELPALSDEVIILYLFRGQDHPPKFTFEYKEVNPPEVIWESKI